MLQALLYDQTNKHKASTTVVETPLYSIIKMSCHYTSTVPGAGVVNAQSSLRSSLRQPSAPLILY